MAKFKRFCKNCNKEFLAEACEINRGNGKFCSLNCAASYGNRLRKVKKSPNCVCAHCGILFYRKPSQIKTTHVYCSTRCFYQATHPLYTKWELIAIIEQFIRALAESHIMRNLIRILHILVLILIVLSSVAGTKLLKKLDSQRILPPLAFHALPKMGTNVALWLKR